MAKKKKTVDPLSDLLATAHQETLIKLVEQLAAGRPEVRRECFDYLKKHGSLTAEQKSRSDGEIALALWWELYPDLEEMDDRGGADHGTEDQVGSLMYEIQQKRAKVMLKVRYMLVDVIKDVNRWKSYAGKAKRDNLRRPVDAGV